MWRTTAIDPIIEDLTLAVRLLLKAPSFVTAVVGTLALGIGVSTAAFSVLYAVLLRPLPYSDSGRLVAIWDREIHATGTSKMFDLYDDYENWKTNARSFEQVAAVSWSPQAGPEKLLRGHDATRSVFALPVTPEFFSLLGVPAQIGRTFSPQDAGHGCLVVLANSFWRKAFNSDPSLIGKSIQLDDQECSVLGVMPPDFAFLPPEAPVSMWTLVPPPDRPDKFAMAVFARLKPGVPLAAVQAEVSTLHRQLHGNERWGKQVEPVVYGLHQEFVWLTGRNLEFSLIVALAAAGLVLLIGCVNVANLLLARSLRREREIAIRASLGSGRGRIVRELFSESLLLSLGATIVGMFIAQGVISYVRLANPIELPPGTRLGLNPQVFAFAACLGVLTPILFGLLPAWKTSRRDLNEVLKTSGRTDSGGASHRRFRKLLIVAEVMLTVVLLSGASLLIETIYRIESSPLGFKPDGLLARSLRLAGAGVGNPERRLFLYEQIETELMRMPSIEGVTFSSVRPISGGGARDVVEVAGHPAPGIENVHDTSQQTITPSYFRAMGIPVIQGRPFARSDSEGGEEVAIVNEALVQKYFPGENPIGKFIRPFTGDDNTKPWLRIVGVTGNEKRTTVFQELAWEASPVAYRPLAQTPTKEGQLIVRVADGAGGTSRDSINRKIYYVNPNIPIEDFVAVSDLASKAMAYPRFRATLLGTLAGLALLISLIGLFAVLSHSVAQRTQEMGVRMALGARKTAVFMLILKEGLVLTVAGLVLGFIAAALLGRYLSVLSYGVRVSDPLQVAALNMVLVPTALIAMYVPARRASSVDPVIALRYE